MRDIRFSLFLSLFLSAALKFKHSHLEDNSFFSSRTQIFALLYSSWREQKFLVTRAAEEALVAINFKVG